MAVAPAAASLQVERPEWWPARTGGALLVAALLVYLLAVLPQLGRPLMYDDANFAFAAQAVAETGLPYGNQGWMSERGDFSQREQWALWHPPLYVYVLGLAARLLGPSEWALRLPGVVGGLAVGMLTFLLARDVARGSRGAKQLAGGIAATLSLLSPLAIQSALLLDIDFALLLPLTLLLLWLYLRLEATPRWPALAPLFALLLWAKMTNPLPLLVAIVAWQALRGNLGRAVTHGLGVGVGGTLLFLASWAALAAALRLPFDMPFEVNRVQWQDSAEVARRAYASLGAFTEGLQPSLVWIGPGLVALGLVALAVRAAQLATRWEPRRVDLLLGLAVLLVAGYVNKSAGWFPKYQVALVPLLAVAGAPLVALALRERRAFALLALGTAVASALVVAGLVGDDWALGRTWVVSRRAGAGFMAVLLAGGAAAPLLHRPWPLLGASRLARQPVEPSRQAHWNGSVRRLVAALAPAGVIVPVLLASLAVGWDLSAAQAQARAPYSTAYWYGTTGVREAAAWVDARLGPAEVYVASKEVAWLASRQRYVDQDTLVFYLASGLPFEDTWAGEPVRALVLWRREPYVATLLDRWLPGSGFREAARFGDYVAYVPGP